MQVLELYVAYKFRKNAGNVSDLPMPNYVKIPWCIFLGFIVFYYLYLRLKSNATTLFTGK